jgi:hypothetical protein
MVPLQLASFFSRLTTEPTAGSAYYELVSNVCNTTATTTHNYYYLYVLRASMLCQRGYGSLVT